MKKKILIASGVLIMLVAVVVWFTMFKPLGANAEMKSQYAQNYSESFVEMSNKFARECAVLNKTAMAGQLYNDTLTTKGFDYYFKTYENTSDIEQSMIINSIKTYYRDFLEYNMEMRFSVLRQEQYDEGKSKLTKEELGRALAEDRIRTEELISKLKDDMKDLQKYFN